MRKEERDDYTIADEDYREVVRNHYLDAKEEAQRQALDDAADSYEYDEDSDEDDYDDGCPLCGRISCSGYCREL